MPYNNKQSINQFVGKRFLNMYTNNLLFKSKAIECISSNCRLLLFMLCTILPILGLIIIFTGLIFGVPAKIPPTLNGGSIFAHESSLFAGLAGLIR